jgi:hypothetical protein
MADPSSRNHGKPAETSPCIQLLQVIIQRKDNKQTSREPSDLHQLITPSTPSRVTKPRSLRLTQRDPRNCFTYCHDILCPAPKEGYPTGLRKNAENTGILTFMITYKPQKIASNWSRPVQPATKPLNHTRCFPSPAWLTQRPQKKDSQDQVSRHNGLDAIDTPCFHAFQVL